MTIALLRELDSIQRFNSAAQEAARNAQLVRDALGPAYEIQQQLARQRQIMDAAFGGQALWQVAEAMRRDMAALDVVANSAVAQFVRALQPMHDMVNSSALKALSDLNPAFEFLRQTSLTSESVNWLGAGGVRQQMENAMRASAMETPTAFSASGSGILATAFAEAVVATSDTTVLDGENLLTYAVRIASALVDRVPGLDVGKAFGVVVTILLTILANIVGDLPTYYLTKASNDASAHRQEVVARQNTEDILRAVGPKTFVTITNVNVRERPERKAKLIRKLPAGILLAELDRDARGWRYVQSLKGDVAFEGWVYYQNIKPKP